MKKPSFDKYVQSRDKHDQNLDEGWFDSQETKNRNAANDAVTKALPAFLQALSKLGNYATPEHAAKMGRYIVQLGQGDTNNFLNKEIVTTTGKATVAQFLKKFSGAFQAELFQGTAFKNYEEYKKAFDAVANVKRKHEVAHTKFAENMKALASALKKQVAKDHGPDATKKPGAPALDTKGQANAGAQRQGLASKIGSGIGRVFGLGNR